MKNMLSINYSKKSLSFSKFTLSIGLVLMALLFYSCDSDSSNTEEDFNANLIDSETELAEIDDTSENINEIVESAYLETISEDFFKSGTDKDSAEKRFLSDCVVVTKKFMDEYTEITLDYGEGCTTKRGHELSGKIMIQVDKNSILETASLSYSFDNFYINERKIEGSVDKKRAKANENGNPEAQITRNIKIIWEDGSYSTIEGERNREWIDGIDNELWGDNVFSITGSWTIMKRNGEISTSTVKEPLIRSLACRFTVSGILEIETEDQTSQINFGDGECDDIATITKNGNSYDIHIRRKKFK